MFKFVFFSYIQPLYHNKSKNIIKILLKSKKDLTSYNNNVIFAPLFEKLN